MNSTEPTTTASGEPSPRGYKLKLLQARQMRDDSRATIYDRVSLLVEVYNDAEFRAEHGNRSTEKLVGILNDYVDDLAYDFLDLAAILRHFPDRAIWQSTKLSRMYSQMIESHKQRIAEDRPPVRRTAPTPTQLKQQVSETESKLAAEKRRADEAERRVEEIRQQSVLGTATPKPNGRVNGSVRNPRHRTLEGIARVREVAEQYADAHDVFDQVLKLLEFAEAEFTEAAVA